MLVLEEEDGFEAFAGAVGHCVALLARGEAPGALALLAVAEGLVVDFLAHLLVFDEFQGFGEHGAVFLLLQKVARVGGEDGEGCVPRLHAVGAVHEHAFVFHPEKLRERLEVLLEGPARGAFFDVTCERVHGAVDGAEVGKVGVLVFGLDQPPDVVFRALHHPRWPEVGGPDGHQEPEDQLEDPRLGVVVVHGRDIVAVLREGDALIRLHEQLRAQTPGQVVQRVRPPLGVDIRHGQEHLPHVDPPAPRGDGHPVRQQPQLRWHGVDDVPVEHAQHAQPELGPVRAVEGAAQLPQGGARLLHARVLCVGAQDAQHGVVHGGAEDAALALDVQPPPAVVRVRAREQVVLELDGALGGDGRLGHVPGDDQPGKEEHGAAILAPPVAGGQLELGEEGEAVFGGFERCLCGREVW